MRPSQESAVDKKCFVRQHTVCGAAPLVPGIRLHLAREPFEIFHEAETAGAAQPYWAFAWPGGQGLARWLLDNPGFVAGRRVLDVGAGSGISSIAAMMAGAKAAVANDTDPYACAVAELNARLNDVCVEVGGDDMLDRAPDADLILIGDLFYLPELAARVTSFLDRARTRGIPVLYGDRANGRWPRMEHELLASYEAFLTPALEIGHAERCNVWRIG